jgi:hypothetical protein
VVVTVLFFPTNDPEVNDGNQMKDIRGIACMLGGTNKSLHLGRKSVDSGPEPGEGKKI